MAIGGSGPRRVAVLVLALVLLAGAVTATVLLTRRGSASSAVGGGRIMIVGDSLSQGLEGDITWRYRLWQRLTEAKAPVEFVGPYTGTHVVPAVPAGGHTDTSSFDGAYRDRLTFPANHDAVWGKQFIDARGEIRQTVSRFRPDVLIVELGYDDLSWRLAGSDPSTSTPQVLDDLRAFVREARAPAPGVRIVLCTVIQRTRVPGDVNLLRRIDDFNAALPDTVRALNAEQPGSPVVLSDLNSTYQTTAASYDGVHPDPMGEVQVADAVATTLADDLHIGVRPGPEPADVPGPLQVVAPSGLTAQTGPDGVRLSWPHVFGTGGTYVWTRDVTGSGDWERSTIPAVADSFGPSPIPAGHTVEYRVQSTRGYQESIDFSPIAQVSAPPLATVTGLLARPAPGGAVDLSWTAVPGADDYVVYAAPGCTPRPEDFQLAAMGLHGATAFTQASTPPGCMSYQVSAVENGGEGPRSATARLSRR